MNVIKKKEQGTKNGDSFNTVSCETVISVRRSC